MLDRANPPRDIDGLPALRILHVFRAPLGGLFRHVVDLTRGQIEQGHSVGIVCDSSTGGKSAEIALAELAPHLRLGVTRLPMRRNPSPGDLATLRHVISRTRHAAPDIVHGHGSKGGAYARLPGLWASGIVRAYTPHGGSFNYRPGTASHRLYMAVERGLKACTDLFLFESEYIAERFHHYAGTTAALTRIVVNGIAPSEFIPVVPNPDALDFLYIGELRAAKGIDTFIDALAIVDRKSGLCPHVVMAGSGPDRDMLIEQVIARGLSNRVNFVGSMAARKAFGMARTLVVPSRAESLPYVVLEAAGGQMPMVSTNVGGIPEIFGPCGCDLIAPDDAELMASRLIRALCEDADVRAARSAQLAAFVQTKFTTANMVQTVLAAYREAIGIKAGARHANTAEPAFERGKF